jgi:hypothetical protein
MPNDPNVGPYHPNVVAAGAVATVQEVGGGYAEALMRRLEALAVLAMLVESADASAGESGTDAE